MKFHCNLCYCYQSRFWDFPTFWNDTTWNLNHSLTGAGLPFSQLYFFLSIFSIQIANIKSLKYNCQMKEKKKAPYHGTFSKHSKRILKFAIFLSVLSELSLLVTRYTNITNYYMSLQQHINWLNWD